MEAVILAAGEGQRLRPFTVNKPKVMIKVANKPILEHVIDSLRRAGVRDIVMVVGYRKSRVMDYFGDGRRWGVRIRYAVQEKQLGTAHALKQAEKLVGEEFVVVAGDNIIDPLTIKKLEKWSLAYKTSEEYSKYGVIELENRKVRRIVEKPAEPLSNLVNTGIYRFGREIFGYIGELTNLTDVINRMIEDGYELRAVEAERWLDIVYPWDITRVNEVAMDFEGSMIGGKVGKAEISGKTIIEEGAKVNYGAYIENSIVGGSEIGQHVVIRWSSVGENAMIGAFSYIENSVIGDNVVIGPHSYIKDSVIDSGSIIRARFTAASDKAEIVIDDEVHRVKVGAFVGENCNIGSNVVVEPGTIIGNGCRVASGRVVRGRIPDDSMVM